MIYAIAFFVVAAFLDCWTTWTALRSHRFKEANPVARWFIARWGINGLIAVKILFFIGAALTGRWLAFVILGAYQVAAAAWNYRLMRRSGVA